MATLTNLKALLREIKEILSKWKNRQCNDQKTQ